MERNIADKAFFDYDAYLKLTEMAAKEPSDLDVIKECMDAFFSYVHIVDGTEVAIKNAYFRLEGYDLRQAIEGYDQSRKHAHEAAIVCVKMLNRLSAMYDVPEIFSGNTEERLEVADFCLEVTAKIFETRRI